MTRLTAEEIRELSLRARKAKSEANAAHAAEEKRQAELAEKTRQEEAESRERRNFLWKIFYIEAINGNDRCEIGNLYNEDSVYFSELGFRIGRTFVRRYKRKYIEKLTDQYKYQIDQKRHRIETIKEELSNLQKIAKSLANKNGYGEKHSLNTLPLQKWINSNKTTAFACNMEDWFGPNLNEVWVDSLSEVEDLVAHARFEMNHATGPERIRALSQLIESIDEVTLAVRTPVRVASIEKELEEINFEVQRLEHRLAETSECNDFFFSEDVYTVDLVEWGRGRHGKPIETNEIYSYQTVQWFCSTIGQNAFERFDLAVKKLAEQCERAIILEWTEKEDRHIQLQCGNTGLLILFPSWFDFQESFLLLGYRVGQKKHRPKQTVTLRW